MFVFIGGLGTTYAYAVPWMRQLARLHGELFYFIALKDASIQHLDHILEFIIIPWCRQSGERITLVGYSAGCSVLLHAFKHNYAFIKVLLIDPPALFPAWATCSSSQWSLHPSYVPLEHISANTQHHDSLLNSLLFGNPKKELKAYVLQYLLSITAKWTLARWIVTTGWCILEGWTTPWIVNAEILRMTHPELRASLRNSILNYPAYPTHPNRILCHIWASTQKQSHATYASLLAEHSPLIRVHFKRAMDHHMLYRQTRYLNV